MTEAAVFLTATETPSDCFEEGKKTRRGENRGGEEGGREREEGREQKNNKKKKEQIYHG